MTSEHTSRYTNRKTLFFSGVGASEGAARADNCPKWPGEGGRGGYLMFIDGLYAAYTLM
jgi:hypothetical protein